MTVEIMKNSAFFLTLAFTLKYLLCTVGGGKLSDFLFCAEF